MRQIEADADAGSGGTIRWRWLLLQGALIASAGALSFAPPASGTFLVLPLRPASPGETLAWTLPAGARLLTTGPLPGALVISGERARLLGPAVRHGALLIGSASPACSGPEEGKSRA